MRQDRYFSINPAQRQIARTLYSVARDLPLICPHGHVDPRLFIDECYEWGSPVDLLIKPDHYIVRMLYSQGIALEDLGIQRTDGTPVESDHRKIWQTVADHWYLFRGTPTGIWIRDELYDIFDIEEQLNSASAQMIYDALEAKLSQPDFTPRRLFKRFNIEVLATTDGAIDTLDHHRKIRDSDWQGRVIPTFRPDDVVQVQRPDWRDNINKLSDLTGIDIVDYDSYLRAIETRREHFRELGAVATDHDLVNLMLQRTDMSSQSLNDLFVQLLRGEAQNAWEVIQQHTLLEMARMSVEDGMVMQLHVGSYRNHNQALYEQFGRDMGADIPRGTVNFTRGLHTLLNACGNNPRFRLIVFTLDETSYARELAPLAGHYPALLLGPPWWFHDSLNGMRRYFDRVMETAGIYNTAGFNDDTRAFPSIPVRHDVWRRASADWLAGQVVRGIPGEDDAQDMMVEMAYGLAKRAYRLEEA